MNIQQMNYVVAIANNGSFREAAKKLYIAQPSLSNAIRELETELGTELFTRTNKGVKLTADGAEFLEYAQNILTQIDTIQNRYKTAEKSQLFSVSSQHYDFAAAVFAQLIREYPQYVKFRFFETTTLKILEDVHSFQSELGILYLNEQNQEVIQRFLERDALVFEPLSTFQTHIFLGKNHPLANRASLTRADLVDYPQVRFTQEGSASSYFSEDLIESDAQKTVIYTSDRGTLLNFLQELDAYASGSGIVTSLAKKDIRLIPLEDSGENTLGYVRQKNRNLSEIAERFIVLLKQQLK